MVGVIGWLNHGLACLLTTPSSDADSSDRSQSAVDGIILTLNGVEDASLELRGESLSVRRTDKLRCKSRLAFSDQILIGSQPPINITTNPRRFRIANPDGFFSFTIKSF